MTSVLDKEILRMEPQLIQIRHDLHRHPELSGDERNTAALVASHLLGLGLDVQTEVGGHGVVAVVRGARPGPTVALRADMDALPIQEEGSPEYRSERGGIMHACGHDGHTTMLLGAAEALTLAREQMAGDVRLIFQPSEETGAGASGMCAAGVMDGVSSIFALHAWPPLPVGQIGIRLGAMTASADTFEIVVQGRGAHAAYPHLSVDPITAAAQIVIALQTIASREIDPVQPVVVTVAQFHAGSAPNVIPDTAHLTGTIRTHSKEVRASMPDRVRRIAEGVCAAMGATCHVAFRDGTPPVVNDPQAAALASAAAVGWLGPDNVITLPNASMGAEDFAHYLNHAPGALLRLGLGNPTPLHAPTFDFTDAALIVGVRTLVAIALKSLTEQ
jgi:amidohydrolase